MKCERCGRETNTWSMSYFNTDACCMECLQKERMHPDYEKAKRAEHAQVVSGNYNFPGIGLPDKYKKWRKI